MKPSLKSCKFASAWRVTVGVALLTLTYGGVAQAVVLDFDSLPLGPITTLTEDGFQIEWTGIGDQMLIADVGGGDHVLRDSEPGNWLGTAVRVTPIDGTPFVLDSFFACDLTNNPSKTPGESYALRFMGYVNGVKVLEEAFYPTSAIPAEFIPSTFDGVALSELLIHIMTQTPRDDWAVTEVHLTLQTVPVEERTWSFIKALYGD